MAGDAGSAIIKIKPELVGSGFDDIKATLSELEDRPHIIKIKVEDAEGQKGLNNLIKGLDKAGKNAFKQTSIGANSASTSIKQAAKNTDVLHASSQRIIKDSNEYRSALKATNKAVKEMEKNLSSMQDASLGDAKSRKEWENYNKRLTDMKSLRNKLGDPHGNQTNNSFNRNFRNITESAELSLETIKKNGEYSNEVTNQIIRGHDDILKAAEQRAKEESRIEANRERDLEKARAAEQKAYEDQGIREVKERAAREESAQKEINKMREKAQRDVAKEIAKGEHKETERQLKEVQDVENQHAKWQQEVRDTIAKGNRQETERQLKEQRDKAKEQDAEYKRQTEQHLKWQNEVTQQIAKGEHQETERQLKDAQNSAEQRAKWEQEVQDVITKGDRQETQKQLEEQRKNHNEEIKRQAEEEKRINDWSNDVQLELAKREKQETQRQIKEAEERNKKEAEYNQLLKDNPELDYKAQQSILSRRSQIDKELANWTAASRDQRTAESYKNLQKASNALSELEYKRNVGKLSNGEYTNEFRNISKAALEAESNIQHFNKDTLSFGDKFKNAFSNLSRYITPYMVMQKGIETVKQMAQASMEIESAMTRIQIVTGATDTQMTHFFNTASSQAQDLGKSITEVAGSIEVFSRLGYSLGEATELSKFANIMANVGDVSVDEATTGITSIIKGFQMDASSAEHVSDVLIEVGQKYAISASELMQAFQRGGAAMSASGTSFEQSAALFAATNASLQNAATTGTLWKTVSARIRNSKTELQELGESTDDLATGFSKYRDELLQLTGFDIQDATGNYKNLYDIFVGLAQVWDNINGDPARARVAEILGGTRQLSGIMSTITNIKDAMGAFADAQNSAGTAMEANALYMDTTAAHVGQLKAAFQELSHDIFSGSLMKGVVDFGKGSLNAIDGIIDHVGVLGTTLTTLATGKIMKSFMKNMKESENDLEWSLSETFHNKGNLAMLGISAGITAAIAIYEQYQKVQEEQRQKAESGAQAFEKQSAAIDDYANKITDLRTKLDEGSLSESDAYSAKKELLDIQNQLNESYSKGAENLDLFNGSMERNVQQVRDLLKQNAETFLTENGLGVKGSGLSDAINAMENMIGARSISSNQAAFLGEFYQWTEEGKVIREVAKDYEDLFEIQELNYGKSGLYFKGTAQDVQRLTDFMTDLRNAEEGLTTTDTIDYIREMGDTFIGIANERIGKYQEIYDQYKQAKIITDDDPLQLDRSRDAQTAAEWMNEYAKAVADVNEAFLSGNKEELASALDKYSSLNPIIQEAIAPGGALEQYASIFTDIGNQIVQAALQQDKFTKAFTGKDASAVDKRLQTYSNDVKELGLTTSSFLNAYQDVLDGVGIVAGSPQAKVKALVDAMVDAGLVSDASSSSIENVIGQLVTLGIVSEDVSQQIDDVSSSFESFSEYQSTLSSAINSSRSATGLSTEEIEKLTAAYKDLESFDPEKLFENTLNGVHLNNEELKRLNAEIEQSKLTDLAKQLADQYAQYKDLRSQGADTSAIEAEIAATQQLMAQYEGLASAYNAWISAKSGSKERDTYEGIGSGFSEMEKIKDAGWYGDPALNAWLDLVLNPSARTGDAEADWARLGQTIADTGHSILDYWQYDSNGSLVSDGLFMFLDDVNHVFGDAYSTVRDGYNVWDFTGNKLQEVSDMFGLSTEAIQSFERALVDTGGAVIFDNSNLDILTGSLKNLNQKTGILDSAGISLDFDISEMSAGELQAKINELDGLTAEIDIEADGGEDALAMMEALQYLLDQEYYIKLNTETGGGLDSAVQKIERVNQLIAEANSQGINVHTFVEGSTEVQQIAADIAALPTEVQIAIGVTEENLGDPTGIASQFADNSINIPVNYTVHADPEAEYADQNPQVTYGIDAPAAPNYPNQNPSVNYKVNAPPAPNYPNLQRSVTYSVHTVGGGRLTKASGTMTSIARADGSMVNAPWNWKHAYADGKVALDRDELALVNELGTESIIRDGQWMLLPGGMHQEALRKGDIILSAAQTKALIQTGKASGHGHAYADGSILSNAYTLGSAAKRRTNGGSTTSLGSKSSSGSKSKSSGGGSSRNSGNNSEDDDSEKFDWIEIAIDRIERAIKQLGIIAKSTFQTLTTRLRNTGDEIVRVTEEIELQAEAYDRYIQEANSVGLSEDLAQRVRDGAIDINEYSKETQDLINDYQEWYEKALDCDEAILQLHEDLGQLYEDRFNDTKDDFDAQLALLKHLTQTYENGMDDIEARGYLMTTEYYKAMQKVEKQNISVMQKELDALIEKMSQAVNSGEIKEYSQAWLISSLAMQ